MEQHGISQRQLAKRAGYMPDQVNRWFTKNENRVKRPTIESMLILDATIDALIAEGRDEVTVSELFAERNEVTT